MTLNPDGEIERWVCYDGPDHCDCDRAKEAGVCCNCWTPISPEQTGGSGKAKSELRDAEGWGRSQTRP